MGFLGEQLNAHLRDAHAIAQLALPTARRSRRGGDLALGTAFRQHLVETEHHEQLIGDRLEARGVPPLRLKNAAFRTNGFAFVLFRGSQPDTPGKLIAHALFHEHLEIATQELLGRMAELAGDDTTRVVAGAIREDERAMAERLEASSTGPSRPCARSIAPTSRRWWTGTWPTRTRSRQRRSSCSSAARGSPATPSWAALRGAPLRLPRPPAARARAARRARGAAAAAQEAALRLGALDWGALFVAQVDTPAKLAAVAYAFEFLEVGCYEQLKRVARRPATRARSGWLSTSSPTNGDGGAPLGRLRRRARRVAGPPGLA